MVYLLSHIIDHSAEKFPEREAFRFYGQTLTYSELSIRTSQLARVLIEQGAVRGSRVGILLNKCLEMPMAVHGIMKAGAAYVPIDPAAPAERIKYIIRNCGIRILITENSKMRVLSEIVGETELDCLIGTDGGQGLAVRKVPWQEVYSASHLIPGQGHVMEQDLAYIMYTSGSTGEPKGIMHTHYSGLSYAKLSAGTYDLSEKDRLGNHSPLHFDMSTLEFFSGPLRGACSVLIPEEYTRLPASLSKLVEDERLTTWYSVPFALVQLLLRGAMDSRDLSSLRWVLFGGEPFPTKHLRGLMKRLPNARFSNVYGPAEVNQCTCYHVSDLPESTDEPVPIGSLCAGCEGLVVDENDQPVAPGMKGELLVRTPTMMQGYWGRDDLNERAFYYRTNCSNSRDVFYRTGDLVQQTDEGHYKYIGRRDRQIKTRGYRVELDEIEAALLSHGDVEEAAVFTVPDPEGSTLISAGVILNSSMEVTPSDLIKYLKSRLPVYAVPGEIKIYRAFSRTATGKIDRRLLSETAMAEKH